MIKDLNKREAQLTQALPTSKEAEASFVANMLWYPLDILTYSTIVKPEMLHIELYRSIYEVSIKLVGMNITPDIFTVKEGLREAGVAVDESVLMGIFANDDGMAGITLEPVVAEIKRMYRRRVALQAAARIQIEAGAGDPDALVKAQGIINEAIGVMSETGSALVDIVDSYFANVCAAVNDAQVPLYVPTGFDALDKIIGGLWYGQNTVIAGRPGMGKSSVALAIVDNLLEAGKSVYLLSSEMGGEQITNRIMARRLGVNSRMLRDGELKSITGRLNEETERFKTQRITIDDRSGVTPADLAARVALNSYDVVVVDHLGLMMTNERVHGVYERVSRIMTDLTIAAKNTGVAFLTLCQLSRETEHTQNNRPALAHLRDSGRIEEDAFIVAGIYRDVYYNKATATPDLLEMVVLKNREGETGTANLLWVPTSATIQNSKTLELNKL